MAYAEIENECTLKNNAACVTDLVQIVFRFDLYRLKDPVCSFTHVRFQIHKSVVPCYIVAANTIPSVILIRRPFMIKKECGGLVLRTEP